MKHILVRYSEIALKGRNRKFFVNQLAHNIRNALQTIAPDAKIRVKHDCIIIDLSVSRQTSSKLTNKVVQSIACIFGVAQVIPSVTAKPTLDSIKTRIRLFKQEFTKARSFSVRTSRSYKDFPQKSIDVNRILGDMIVSNYGVTVNLTYPDVTLYINIQKEEVFLYTEKLAGPGGLPLGSSGRGLLLLSGGIDSPVASWKMMRRGLMCEFLHFHALSKNSRFNQIPPTKIVKTLLAKQGIHTRLYLAPYYPFQFELLEKQTRYELVVFRRFMLRAAEKIAKDYKLQILVTGDSLGQVASQTLENLVVIDNATKMVVARPLIGDNKQEIIQLAKNIGTYKLSIEDYKDCCSLIGRHPATKSTIEKVEEIEKRLDLGRVLEKTLKEMVTLEI